MVTTEAQVLKSLVASTVNMAPAVPVICNWNEPSGWRLKAARLTLRGAPDDAVFNGPLVSRTYAAYPNAPGMEDVSSATNL